MRKKGGKNKKWRKNGEKQEKCREKWEKVDENGAGMQEKCEIHPKTARKTHKTTKKNGEKSQMTSNASKSRQNGGKNVWNGTKNAPKWLRVTRNPIKIPGKCWKIWVEMNKNEGKIRTTRKSPKLGGKKSKNPKKRRKSPKKKSKSAKKKVQKWLKMGRNPGENVKNGTEKSREKIRGKR